MKYIYITGVVLLAVVGGGLLLKPTGAPQPRTEQTPAADTQISLEISLQELAQHNSADDCWMAIDGTVYDVTDYIPEHGDRKIVEGCGVDASQMFAAERKHAVKGRVLLADYEIGKLDE